MLALTDIQTFHTRLHDFAGPLPKPWWGYKVVNKMFSYLRMTSSGRYLEMLPRELIWIMAETCKLQDILALSRTSTHFYRILRDPLFWNKIADRLGLAQGETLKTLRDLSNLQRENDFAAYLLAKWGLEKYAEIPLITGCYSDELQAQELPASLVRCKKSAKDREHLVIRFSDRTDPKHQLMIIRSSECILTQDLWGQYAAWEIILKKMSTEEFTWRLIHQLPCPSFTSRDTETLLTQEGLPVVQRA